MSDHPSVLELLKEFRELRSQVLPVGNRTKPGLSSFDQDTVTTLSTVDCKGIVAYDPSEFLISALAGTQLQDIVSALRENGQYLPFDPPFLERNPTLGGTIAAGISGSQRLLYGGVRDFVMEVQFIDGAGELVRGGGKVVKNAAGFDLPKMMCGSYGRLGIMTEITLKVLPQPTGQLTLEASASMQDCRSTIHSLGMKCLPISGIDLTPISESENLRIQVTCMAPEDSLTPIQEAVAATTELSWQERGSMTDNPLSSPIPSQLLYRLTTDIDQLLELHQLLTSTPDLNPLIYTCSGKVAWCNCSSPEHMDAIQPILEELGVSAVSVAGAFAEPHFTGDARWKSLAKKIKQAIDPQNRFPCY